MSSLARAERAAICATFERVGAGAPTLCEGWTAAHLAAHLVIRETRPDLAAGILVPLLAGRLARAIDERARDDFAGLVNEVRHGPPIWTPTGLLPFLDEAANTAEFFVHHEDLLRAQPGWDQPRVLDDEEQQRLWDTLQRMSGLLYRRAEVGVVLVADGIGRQPVKDPGAGHRTVVVRGPVTELVMFSFGRPAAARVTFKGPTADITAGLVAVALLVGACTTGGSSAGAASTGAASSGSPAPTVPTVPTGPTGPTDPTAARTAPAAVDWRSGPQVAGVDVSAYQPRVDWPGLHAAGVRFAWVKATEGRTWRSPTHDGQRAGARAGGILAGAYHYARPASSSGAVQARFFVANGGGWSPDGLTLPGALDLERNDSGDPCYDRTPAQLVAWVRDFSDTYRGLTGRAPVIYAQADLWAQCLADDRSFGATNPLWLFDHEGEVGPWPPGWERPTVWQRGVEGGLDRNVFFGTEADLRAWALRAAGPA